jgi:hypothetical protein
MISEAQRIAVVVSHPVHLLTVAGMLLRWRPHLLMVLRAPTGPGAGQADLIRKGLAMAGLNDRATFLDVDEDESYRQALAGNPAMHLELADRLRAWLSQVKPQAVLGDAFEASNFQHDVVRLMLDEAVRRCRAEGLEIGNYEFPLSSREDRPGATLRYGSFPAGDRTEHRLSPAEADLKRTIIDWSKTQDAFVAKVAQFFPSLWVETHRPVPESRDYSRPPEGLALHYDVRGREEVAAGRYETPILFDRHFLPIVEAVRREARGTSS